MHAGRVGAGRGGSIVLPPQDLQAEDEFVGAYRHNRRGFGFVVPTDPDGPRGTLHPRRAKRRRHSPATSSAPRSPTASQRDGKVDVPRPHHRNHPAHAKAFRRNAAPNCTAQWLVFPDGNILTAPILTPDAASRHIKPGTKVVVEMTTLSRAKPSRPGRHHPSPRRAGRERRRPQLHHRPVQSARRISRAVSSTGPRRRRSIQPTRNRPDRLRPGRRRHLHHRSR